MKWIFKKKQRKVGFVWNLVNFAVIVIWELIWKHVIDNPTHVEFNGVDCSDFVRHFSYWALCLIGPAYYFFWVLYSLKHTRIGKPTCYEDTLESKWDDMTAYLWIVMDLAIYITIAVAWFMIGSEVNIFADDSCWWIGALFTILGLLMIGWPFMIF